MANHPRVRQTTVNTPAIAAAQNDAFTTDEASVVAGDLFADNGSGADDDPAAQPFFVTEVNGSSGNVGVEIALLSGALLTVHDDGTFSYDPNHAFDSLPAAGSGASVTQATEQFTYTVTGGDTATVTLTVNGLDSADTLDGTAGDDDLNGGVDGDLMRGFAGNDDYYVDNPHDHIVEAAGQGLDRLFASNSYGLDAGVSVEEMRTIDETGTLNISLTGNELVQDLYGNAGNNRLDGGGAADGMTGYGGNDWYYVDNPGDVIVEAAGQGYDRIYASVSYVLAAGREIEEIHAADPLSTAAIDLTGNSVEQYLFGNAGDNKLDGGGGPDIMTGLGGNDWYYVDSSGDLVRENAGAGYDRVYASVSYALAAGADIEELQILNPAGTAAIDLTGNAVGQYLFGNAGANRLDGGGGADTMTGYAGNDSYYLDDAADAIVEASGQGYDRAYTSASYTLAAGVSIEELFCADPLGTAPISLTGNAIGQWLLGNAGANILRGGGGNVGGGYSDVLVGYGGDDTYYTTGNDRIVEAVGGGFDRVYIGQYTYSLVAGAEVEEMYATATPPPGSGPLTSWLVGNQFAQTMYGTAGDDRLNGGGAADTLVGYAGNDHYYVDNAADVVVEVAGQGHDHITCTADYVLAAGVSVEELHANAANFTAGANRRITGNELAQYLTGNAGNDVLDGAGGADTLRGNSGADTFAFSTALGNGNIDRIEDLAVGTDKVGLSSSVFGLSGPLQASQFVTGTAAQDADDRIIYDPATGNLYFDADGSGANAAIQFATLNTGLALTANDFVVFGP